MKKSKKFNYLFGFALILLIGMQSCSVFFGVTGAVMDGTDDTNYDMPIDEGDGWIQPVKKNSRLILTLTNNKVISGVYKGFESKIIKDKFVQIIKVKTPIITKEIPVKMIAHTAVYRKNKNWTKTGILIGLATDIAVFAIWSLSGYPGLSIY